MIRVLLVILASGLFLPVSCTGVTIMSVKIASYTDTRDLLAGDKPFPILYVLFQNKKSKEIKIVRYKEYDTFVASSANYSLFLPEESGMYTRGEYLKIRYEILAEDETGTTLSFRYSDDDYTADWKYRIENNRVIFIESGMLHMGHAMTGLFFGLLLAGVIQVVARYLLKRRRRAEGQGEE